MPKFTVHMLTPYASWEGVEAESAEKAAQIIAANNFPDEFDIQDGPCRFVATEESPDDEEGPEEALDPFDGTDENPDL